MQPKFHNEVSIQVLSGETGEVKYDTTKENAISDDFLCPYAAIYTQQSRSNEAPYAFLLPDGPNWSGFIFDRSNPWAPYSIAVNNYVNTSADPQWKGWGGPGGYTPPSGVLGQTKLFYQWTQLPTDFELRAIGLTGWQSFVLAGDIPDISYGAGVSPNTVNQTPTVFIPQTLVVLPAAILVHGISPGGIPDILQVSYFLSIVGVN